MKDKKNDLKDESLEFADQKIIPVNMEKEVKKSFIEYSMSVIVSRALPDVRDGMKPGARRVLYAMYEDNLTYDKPFRKSATTVGNVLGRPNISNPCMAFGRMPCIFSLTLEKWALPISRGHGKLTCRFK